MLKWFYYPMYAVRQSSKGWSDIIAVCDSAKEAEELCKSFKNAVGDAKTNFRVEILKRYLLDNTTIDNNGDELPF